MKTPEKDTISKHTLKNTLSSAHEQGDGILWIIEKDGYATEDQLEAAIDNKFRLPDYNGFRIYLKYKDDWSFYDKETWEAKKRAQKKP